MQMEDQWNDSKVRKTRWKEQEIVTLLFTFKKGQNKLLWLWSQEVLSKAKRTVFKLSMADACLICLWDLSVLWMLKLLAYCFFSHFIRQIFVWAICIASPTLDTDVKAVNLSPFSLQQPLLDMKTVTISPFSSRDETVPHLSCNLCFWEWGDPSHGFLLIFLG